MVFKHISKGYESYRSNFLAIVATLLLSGVLGYLSFAITVAVLEALLLPFSPFLLSFFSGLSHDLVFKMVSGEPILLEVFFLVTPVWLIMVPAVAVSTPFFQSAVGVYLKAVGRGASVDDYIDTLSSRFGAFLGLGLVYSGLGLILLLSLAYGLFYVLGGLSFPAASAMETIVLQPYPVLLPVSVALGVLWSVLAFGISFSPWFVAEGSPALRALKKSFSFVFNRRNIFRILALYLLFAVSILAMVLLVGVLSLGGIGAALLGLILFLVLGLFFVVPVFQLTLADFYRKNRRGTRRR